MALESFGHEAVTGRRMPNMKWRGSLAFDFFVPRKPGVRERDAAIEFDGGQHFMPTNSFKVPLAVVQARDRAKNLYCGEHAIDLLRIDDTVPLDAFSKIIGRFLRDTAASPGTQSICRFVGQRSRTADCALPSDHVSSARV